MMNNDQIKIIREVLNKLSSIDASNPQWDSVDEAMLIVGLLENKTIIKECEVLLKKHKKGNPRCPIKHIKSECFVPKMIEAVESVIDLFKETRGLHEKNKYILQYYIVLSKAGDIIS